MSIWNRIYCSAWACTSCLSSSRLKEITINLPPFHLQSSLAFNALNLSTHIKNFTHALNTKYTNTNTRRMALYLKMLIDTRMVEWSHTWVCKTYWTTQCKPEMWNGQDSFTELLWSYIPLKCTILHFPVTQYSVISKVNRRALQHNAICAVVLTDW